MLDYIINTVEMVIHSIEFILIILQNLFVYLFSKIQ